MSDDFDVLRYLPPGWPPPITLPPQRIPPAYTRLALHDDVPVATLTKALTRFGLTLSNVHGVGLVIHKAEQEPTCPSAS